MSCIRSTERCAPTSIPYSHNIPLILAEQHPDLWEGDLHHSFRPRPVRCWGRLEPSNPPAGLQIQQSSEGWVRQKKTSITSKGQNSPPETQDNDRLSQRSRRTPRAPIPKKARIRTVPSLDRFTYQARASPSRSEQSVRSSSGKVASQFLARRTQTRHLAAFRLSSRSNSSQVVGRSAQQEFRARHNDARRLPMSSLRQFEDHH